MNNLYILIGIPGCGKSTWAKNNNDIDIILSSDDYRERLFNNVNDQSHNAEVFNTLYKDLDLYLSWNKNVCLDATNLTRKTRCRALDIAKKFNCKKVAVVFAVDENLCKKRNANRERVVPEEVINKMLGRIELPFLGEGFDEIKVEYELDPLYTIKSDWCKMINFDQQNPHHSLLLGEHCNQCYNYLVEHNCDNPSLVWAAKYHDIGKLYTKTFDEKAGYCHYIGHANYGAYKVLTADSDEKFNKYWVAFYINYHMEPFRLLNAKESTKKYYIKQFGNYFWRNLLLLHEADKNAS